MKWIETVLLFTSMLVLSVFMAGIGVGAYMLMVVSHPVAKKPVPGNDTPWSQFASR